LVAASVGTLPLAILIEVSAYEVDEESWKEQARPSRQQPARERAPPQPGDASAIVRRAPAARVSFEKFEVLFWLVYLLLPTFTGWLDYKPPPNEHYDPQQHELLSFHIREGWPNGLGSYEVPETWRDQKSGQKYSVELCSEHHQSEARRLGITRFVNELLGCAFFAYGRVVKKNNTFLKGFRRAVMVDFAVSILAFLIV
jgi:hypothetical protein